MTRVILIHHHIFKNAGTSFNYALKQYFQEQFLEYDLPDSRVVTADRLEQFILNHPQAVAISGHHIALPAPQGQEYQTLSSILLRRPLARVRSIYEFEKRQQVETEGSVKAKALSFKDYVQWRLDTVPATLSNYQTQYCSRTTDLGAAYSASEQDLEVAIGNLRRCIAVGTVERYEDFLRSAQRQIVPFYPEIVLKTARLNTTSQPDSELARGDQRQKNGGDSERNDGARNPTNHAPDNRVLDNWALDNRALDSRELDADEKLKLDLINDLGQDLFDVLEENNQLDEKLYQAANAMLTRQSDQITVAHSILRTNRKRFTPTSKGCRKPSWLRAILHSFFTS